MNYILPITLTEDQEQNLTILYGNQISPQHMAQGWMVALHIADQIVSRAMRAPTSMRLLPFSIRHIGGRA